jgi:anti-sigma factor RsiW
MLQAYCDGELKGFARWRFQRRLERSPALQRELATIALVGELVRQHEAEAPAPDLWAAIAQRLPAADAQRGVPEREGGALAASLQWLLRPLGAVAAVAAAVALAFVLLSGDNAVGGVVRWMDSGGRSVMVFEGDEETTIIWVMGSAERPRSTGGARGLA